MFFAGLFAITFKDNKEPAFAGLKMFQSVGGCLNFATAKYMCTRTKVLIVGGLLTWAVAGVVVLEVVTRRRERKALLGQVGVWVDHLGLGTGKSEGWVG